MQWIQFVELPPSSKLNLPPYDSKNWLVARPRRYEQQNVMIYCTIISGISVCIVWMDESRSLKNLRLTCYFQYTGRLRPLTIAGHMALAVCACAMAGVHGVRWTCRCV
eukprot:GHVT01062439.1.p1 GENE.GHVT01062439.1~~GHVT01062439.1.p1  ORF type:complete len:108 (+),score=2.39 GHVT01062439.1:142-465(+)